MNESPYRADRHLMHPFKCPSDSSMNYCPEEMSKWSILNNTKFLDLFLIASVVVHRLNTQFRLKMKVLFTVGTKRTSSSRALYNRSKRAHTTKRNSLEFRMWIARQTNATIYQSDDFLIYECNVNFLVFILFCSFVVWSRQRSVMGTCAPHKLRFVYKCTIF